MKGAGMSQRMSCEFKVPAVPGAVPWWCKQSTSATTTRLAAPCTYPTAAPETGRAITSPVHEESSMVGMSGFRSWTWAISPYSVQTSVPRSTLTQVSEMTVAWTSSRRKHRRVDRDCTVQVHGGSWAT